MNHQEEQGDDQQRKNYQKWVIDIDCCDQQDQETNKDKVVDHHQEGDPQEDEVAQLDDKEKCPSVTSLCWVSIWVLELGKERVSKEGVRQYGKREREY
ncbi:hypothetical protein PanWU01x14_335570 [Parasponia andersonii]|uniref:Uncharacterized protein n=1 Tax=Parasponia andersonii TaxID=3476 RepID=A0A2P5AG67_PARAD|nr:hypothetical protein PanWU01x14_335570 [Parasponia andersonii]